jgi:hypothetical protein
MMMANRNKVKSTGQFIGTYLKKMCSVEFMSPIFFTIFQLKVLKFWILIEDEKYGLDF